ncbi:MAG: Unknown protein [uncultured Sulfurovum sp.]|uniref:Uncharacterized protein n=1 Tax=uncultured Sulfurovum sp. TaxID=269237 RepID=A0A6S6RYI9_9BACT|nr:MAG: Unknown protein [uncultured Sulfurovum sp.]
MKTILYILTLIAIITTLALGLEQSVALGYLAFTILPYVITLYILKISKHKTAKNTAYSTAIFVVSVGLYFLIDTTYMENNLEHKFSFLFIPMWQLTMLLVSGLVVYFSNRKDS